MKLAILCDTHLGCRNDSKVFLEHQETFFRDLFFPVLDERNIDTVLHLGDVFDRRKYINFFTLARSNDFFFRPLQEKNIQMHTILGNHDTFFTNTNRINAVTLLLESYSNIHVYEDEPVELKFDSTKILMCPWLTPENRKHSYKVIKKSKAHILCGHFGLKGFEMMRGIVSEHGDSHKDFSHFELVLSGHFHYPSHYGNIKYPGSQYEMNWSDFDSRRGFYLLDTETRDLEFIENPNRIHHKLEYDDEDMTIDDLASLDVSNLRNCFVKVVVKNKTNPYLYDLFINKMNDSGAADVKTIQDDLNLYDIGDFDKMLDETQDTKDILHSYIDSVETTIDRKKIKSVIDELYQEAINL